jgi:hypothetical protein
MSFLSGCLNGDHNSLMPIPASDIAKVHPTAGFPYAKVTCKREALPFLAASFTPRVVRTEP